VVELFVLTSFVVLNTKQDVGLISILSRVK
jgi:hypothetical protein